MADHPEEMKLLMAEDVADYEDNLNSANVPSPPRRGRLHHACFMVVAVAVVAIVAATMLHGQDAFNADVSSPEGFAVLEPFQLCGQVASNAAKCCAPGCACLREREDYSRCLTPGKGRECSRLKAFAEAESAGRLVEKTLPKVKASLLRAVIKWRKARAALRSSEGASAIRDHKTEVHEKLKREQQEKKQAADVAGNTARDAAKAVNTTAAALAVQRKVLSQINASIELRLKKQCGLANQQCGPVDGIKVTKLQSCCVDGCHCHWQSAWFAQCLGPNMEPYCVPGQEKAWSDKQLSRLRQIESELKQLQEVNDTKAAEESHARASVKNASMEAEKAERAQREAEAIAKKLKRHADQAMDAAKAAEQVKIQTREQIRLFQLAVQAWHHAAEGTGCEAKNVGMLGKFP
mmetsp:Transcript_122923/g.244509  ORF Transcript_122923/g.244509 Transcript_122923/m.244509 type:complete len:406 (-) Transcript_122923:90-1307(-)|eukprot:CAMPEP_0172718100 /NCGR_PEP_ID=MMETSP1074-20121228/73362_1 /TAXON_ID=2916 /ORGANISM="Ceratium fusus, Strain PA161109" /LENGTH=405 /DNA_ID=CAMNT_0013543189 /DNA_START=32 /DNA_END=1249 /DNA_ORIENTATION=+